MGYLSCNDSHSVQLNQDVIRIFVTFCDSYGVGRPGYVDVSASDPLHVLGVSQNPLLDVGLPGTFDENGVLNVVLSTWGWVFYMYYAGLSWVLRLGIDY